MRYVEGCVCGGCVCMCVWDGGICGGCVRMWKMSMMCGGCVENVECVWEGWNVHVERVCMVGMWRVCEGRRCVVCVSGIC